MWNKNLKSFEICLRNLGQKRSLFLSILENAIFEGKVNTSIGVERAPAAFMEILEGVFVEMLYGGPQRLVKRIDASW
ncbi:hypothetical protein V7152_25305 [Neobacillus drentensis]